MCRVTWSCWTRCGCGWLGLVFGAELREHLMGLVVFAAAQALLLCVFVTAGGRLLSWQAGQAIHEGHVSVLSRLMLGSDGEQLFGP